MMRDGFAPENRLAERQAVYVCTECCSDQADWGGCRACGSENVEILTDDDE